ncbi:OmpA family protein [Flavicella sp.]|uniref:OmpA family protein n=1 Tax=Flavicella sp. TaxID=2957742 RepID=UPI003017A9F0
MKKIKIGIICMLFLIVGSLQAQDENNKWALSFGVNAVDINNGGTNDIGHSLEDYVGTSDWNILPAITTISASRYLNYGLSVKVTGSLNKIDEAPKGDVDGLSFFSLSAAAVYDLNSWFGETGWFDPYVQFGLGGTWIDDSSSFIIRPGLGFNTWFNENIGLNFDSSFSYATSEFTEVAASNYFQHSVSLILKFGGPTKKDTDGDGIPDEDDDCPNEAGPIENNGCPWPDTDGDGVLDKDDDCPNVAGPIENNGCPWPDMDNDGVPDKDDKCPKVKGTIENQGCPEITKTQIKKIGEFSKKISFNTGKVTLKTGVSDKLDGLAKVMAQYPTTTFHINGYTDSTGSKAKNLEISKLRAKTVKDYLVSKGIKKSQLKSYGYGIESPIDTNKTASGRKANRRVEIIAQ